MQMKNTRGVQQKDVSEAADALLALGVRPTIERIRHRMGRGSPNTVAPLLETWFAGLGKRLGLAGEDGVEDPMPAAVAQAFAKLWDAALLMARQEVEGALAQDKEAVSHAHDALSERESSLNQREQAFIQLQEVAAQLLRVEREKTAVAETNLATFQQHLQARDVTVNELRTALAGTQEQLKAARDRSDAQDRLHTEERIKWEERATGNERRLLSEIDHERQAAKVAHDAAEKTAGQLQAIRGDMEKRTVDLGQKLHVSEMELANTRHTLEICEVRNTEVIGQLHAQRAANEALHKRLDQAISALAGKTAAPKRKATAAKP